MDLKRSEYCGGMRPKDIGREVIVCGWAQRQRDLGKLIFIDLRDRTGLVQLNFNESTEKSIFDKAFGVRAEYVLAAKGIVKERSSKNMDIPTGEIEIEVNEFKILAKSETPPFEIQEDSSVNEELRLKYRYLDLRRPDVQSKILQRHKIVKVARDYFDANRFVEIETPVLIKSTPEGARDYLVPSRVFRGKFFALPQSPQLYKQLSMIAGFDRYMQIAKCFRDEDLRADRQPEFTQIDFEMSFVDEEDVMAIAEGYIKEVYKRVLDEDIEIPMKRLTYKEAMKRYGSDKPDLRFEMELIDVSDELRTTEFKIFANTLKNGGAIKGINLKGGADKFTRKEIDKLGNWILAYGAKGLAWAKLNKDGSASSSYEKFLKSEEACAVRSKLGAENGDLIFLVADKPKIAAEAMGALRLELAKKTGLIDGAKPCLLWVTEFPLFEYDEEEDRLVAKHHPFTMPNPEDLDKLETNPEEVRALAYDMVLNGNEVGGGSVRINTPELQARMFKALGFTPERAREQFGFLMDAFKYGAPPHAGMAFGLDRLVMLMLNCDSIRDVIAYPKVASSAELMSSSPDVVDKKQLDELGITLSGN